MSRNNSHQVIRTMSDRLDSFEKLPAFLPRITGNKVPREKIVVVHTNKTTLRHQSKEPEERVIWGPTDTLKRNKLSRNAANTLSRMNLKNNGIKFKSQLNLDNVYGTEP